MRRAHRAALRALGAAALGGAAMLAPPAQAVSPLPPSRAEPPASAASGSGVGIGSTALQGTSAALGDLGLALLRSAPGANAVVSPLAVATVLGMVQSGAEGATEREIEALFGAGRSGAQAMRITLPALSAQMRQPLMAQGREATPVRQAARVWLDAGVAPDVLPGFKRRLAHRHAADAAVLRFADADAARDQINRWVAEHTAGRVQELLPAGSVARSTRLTLTAALHFRSAWSQPFEADRTVARAFATASGTPVQVPTMHDDRPVAQAVIDGVQLYALPFAAGFDLVIALPAAAAAPGSSGTGSPVQALLESITGITFARWHAELKLPAQAPARCSFSMPRFGFAPKAGSIKAALQQLGVRRAFTDRAELRPMLGRAGGGLQVDDVHHAAGIAVDEAGGEAVAAAAATVKPKTMAPFLPACAVDRAFAFAVLHRASGAPLFVGRVSDPSLAE